ncbi:MAG: tetratricopeptide repeat protein [Gammaproteobacteria bacterium]|nr:tetratricopeptide repeat protein [Gammaproteobacteria bacterium]
MSLINQMLKDLEKRRSRDLETSESLSNNITWETRPASRNFNFQTVALITILVALIFLVAYLFWERSEFKEEWLSAANKQIVVVKNNKKSTKVKHVKARKRTVTKKQTSIKTKSSTTSNQAYAEAIETDNVVDTEEVENDTPIKLNKKHRPLNYKQLAEIEYKKGYLALQQGRMRQGKERLRESLSLYAPHLKSREMLAGIYIKSGRYVEAAELLREGIRVVPTYSLFAKLYARVLLEQNNPRLAIKVLENSAKALDVDLDYHALLAATYQRVKNHKKAISIYLQLVKEKSSVGIWWLGLAISLEKSGKNKEALDAYQRAQKTGSLKAGLVKFTNNRVSALKEIGFPES